MLKQADCTEELYLGEQAPARPADYAGSFAKALVAAIAAGFAIVSEWQRRAMIRNRMASLSEHMLNDIGLSREQVAAEAGKPFWKK